MVCERAWQQGNAVLPAHAVPRCTRNGEFIMHHGDGPLQLLGAKEYLAWLGRGDINMHFLSEGARRSILAKTPPKAVMQVILQTSLDLLTA